MKRITVNEFLQELGLKFVLKNRVIGGIYPKEFWVAGVPGLATYDLLSYQTWGPERESPLDAALDYLANMGSRVYRITEEGAYKINIPPLYRPTCLKDLDITYEEI